MKINEVTFKHDLKQLEEEIADLNKASKKTAPELLKAQMPMVRQIEKNLAAYGYEKGTKEYQEAFDVELAYYRKFGFPSVDKYNDRVEQDVDEGVMSNMLAKAYDVGASMGGKVKSALGMNYQPQTTKFDPNSPEIKAELDNKAFVHWKNYANEIIAQKPAIQNNPALYKRYLDAWLTKFFKMHHPYSSDEQLYNIDDNSVREYISRARRKVVTGQVNVQPLQTNVNRNDLMPFKGQTVSFSGTNYRFLGKQWAVLTPSGKASSMANKAVVPQLNKLAADALIQKRQTQGQQPQQDISGSDIPAFMRRKATVRR